MNRIAIAQINPTLGAFEENAKKIIEFTIKAKKKDADLVIFPEATLFGYHPFDLLERSQAVKSQLQQIRKIQKAIPKKIGIIFGAITENKSKKGKPYFNSAVFIERNRKAQFFHKELLPTGDVFDEARFIESGKLKENVLYFNNKKILITICEDIWAWDIKKQRNHYRINPLEKIKGRFDLVLNLSASPFYPKKISTRISLMKMVTKKFKCPSIYCNMVGAQDEIIFDGASFALNEKGNLIANCSFFEEDLSVLDLETQKGITTNQNLTSVEMLHNALVLGIRDFCLKTGFTKIHLGLSGGIDSAVVACLAVDALGAGAVAGISMPGPFNSPNSHILSEALAKNLNIKLNKVEINSVYEEFKKLIDKEFLITNFSVVHENLQARIRGLILMAYANLNHSLLLSTGNKSEFATGYSTLYGDMCGGLVPIGDLTKNQVYELADFYNLQYEIIPREIIVRAPSAELRPNQKDQDTLPEYDILDKCVTRIVDLGLKSKSQTEKWLVDLLFKSEFKRWQAPPVLKVSKHSFGRGRRFPIAHKFRE